MNDEMIMKKINRKTLIFALSATLLCMTMTVRALDEQTVDTAENAMNETVFGTRWDVVSIDSVMPDGFLNTRTNAINRAAGLHQVFDTLCLSGRPLRVLHLGDSHVAGKMFPNSISTMLEEKWGRAENDSAGSGLHYRFMGKNGATTKHFANEEKMQSIAETNPDLIILSFGTNECHGMGYLEDVHEGELSTFHDMLRTACPAAVIMMTTPPGDYLTRRRVRYVKRRTRGNKRRTVRRVTYVPSRINPMTARCAAELESFGEKNGLPVWDMNTIVGGDSAVINWEAANMMRPDKVHYTAEGYSLQGKLLGEAILKAYNAYVEERKPKLTASRD